MSNTPNTPNNTPNDFAFVGSGGTGETGGGWFLADRTDIPFVTDRDDQGLLGDLITNRADGSFGDRDWAAKWNAWRLLFEFLQNGGIDTDAGDPNSTGSKVRAVLTAALATPQERDRELDNLVRAASDERAEALGEILSQDAEVFTDFMGLLSMTPGSHPRTYRLLHAAGLIGLYGVMFFKGVYGPTRNRPRPSQLRPALMPPIPLPGHAAFPSGHATLAYLMAFCIGHLFEPRDLGTVPTHAIVRSALVLARRIARNREIAGLHYESDSTGGQVLAAELFKTLIKPANVEFNALVTMATEEWR